MAEVIVVGSANVDCVVRVARHPRPGETVLGGDTVISPGGKGANTAVAAARLGANVALLGAIGDDQAAAVLLGALADAGVGTGLLRRVSGSSGAAYIAVSDAGENAIVVSPGANARVGVDDVHRARAAIGAARVLFGVLEVPMDAVRAAVAVAVDAGVRVVLNASPVRPLPDDVLTVADPLIVNRHEAAELLGIGESDGPELAEAVRALGPRSVVVTFGADGAVIADAEGSTAISAPEVEAVDTTGAGDAFSGALCCGLAKGLPLREAARDAVGVASDAVTRRGAQLR